MYDSKFIRFGLYDRHNEADTYIQKYIQKLLEVFRQNIIPTIEKDCRAVFFFVVVGAGARKTYIVPLY